eukprot:1081227-Pelagomonas_calceolata.AAC.2
MSTTHGHQPMRANRTLRTKNPTSSSQLKLHYRAPVFLMHSWLVFPPCPSIKAQGLNDLKERFADLISQGLEDFTAVQRRQSPLGNLLPLDHPSIVSNGSSNS